MRTNTLRNAISIALFAITNGATSLATAQDADHLEAAQVANEAQDAQHFDVPPGALGASLDAIAAQSGLRITYPPAFVANRPAPAVQGRMHWREAMTRLLQGSGLDYRQADDDTVVIAPAHAEPERRVAPAPADARAPQGANATELETITVTGTRIRGGTTPSPVITLGSERIREEGFADLGEVIRSVPQNFSGGQNPGVLMGNVAGAGGGNQNVTGGSSLNLRGLGPDASLTLLNGRRMAYGGFVQAIDISAVPVEAVERIEIVTDGASAIYGSDAVGGVANVILKRDFEGFATGIRYGGATGGGMRTREYTATGGAAWSGGGFIATVKDGKTDPIYARQRAYTDHLREPQMLFPKVDVRSALLSAHQTLGDAVEVRVDALRTERQQRFDYWAADPASYNALSPETTTTFVSPGVDVHLANDWLLSLSGTWGKDEWQEAHFRVNPVTQEAAPQVSGCYCNSSRAYELGAEGPVFNAGGGDARVAVGLGYRENAIRLPAYISGGQGVGGGEGSSRFGYAELHMPLVGPVAGATDSRRLELTAAVRSEDYGSSFGSVTTPKLGVLYSPMADVTFKTSWGRSFKAPTLFQSFRQQGVLLVPPTSLGGRGFPADATVLYAFGGNPNLEPERARVLNASLAFHPRAIPGLDVELGWFDIDYVDRVVEPITAFSQALANPAFAEFVGPAPTFEEQAALIAAIGQFLNATGTPYDPGKVAAFVESRYVNAVRQRIRGLDLTGAYRFEMGSGQLTVRGSTSWLDSTQQSAGSSFDLAGTLHHPAKLSGRLGSVWSQGGFSASLFANYRSGVRNVVANEKSASFTTLDLNVRHAFGERAGVWSGLEVALTGENLLDRAPPLYTVAASGRGYVPPYDSTNYSPVGRFLSISATKRW